MVILFSAFIAPNAMFGGSHFIHRADHAQRPFLVVAVLLVLEERSWVDDTQKEVEHVLDYESVCQDGFQCLACVLEGVDNVDDDYIDDEPGN